MASADKIDRWRSQTADAAQQKSVKLNSGFDLSLHPRSKRGSFPYPILPPFEVLRTEDLTKRLVKLSGDPLRTAFVSFVAGGLSVKLAGTVEWLAQRWGVLPRPALLRLVALFLTACCFYRWYLSPRTKVTVLPVSEPLNVSSNPRGPCMVTSRVLTLSNSHAGTHADSALHFLPKELASTAPYYTCQYTGDAIVLDLTEFLYEGHRGKPDDEPDLAITAEILKAAGVKHKVIWSAVWRLLVVTRKPKGLAAAERRRLTTGRSNGSASNSWGSLGDIAEQGSTRSVSPGGDAAGSASPGRSRCENTGSLAVADAADLWEANFAHLSIDGARFLGSQCDNLLLFGIDSPSVDHPNAGPILEHAHGALWQARIAILENLDLSSMGSMLRGHDGLLVGSVQTVFNPLQDFEDSNGCQVMFYPDVAEN